MTSTGTQRSRTPRADPRPRQGVVALLGAMWWRRRRSLQATAASGDIEGVRSILSQGADVDGRRRPDGHTALHTAVIARSHDVTTLLLEQGADVDAPDVRGWTPLHYATAASSTGSAPDPALVAMLMAHGADANARTRDTQRTPLHQAVATHLTDAVSLIRGDPANRPQPIASAMLERASSSNGRRGNAALRPSPHYEVTALLLAHGADVNARDERGWTPLHHAATVYAPDHGAELVHLLLKHGADAGVRTGDSSYSPLDHARITGLRSIATLIEAAGTSGASH